MKLQIDKIYSELVRREQEELEKRTEAVYAKVPALKELPERRRDIFCDAARKKIGAEEACRKLEELDCLETQLLEDAGLSKDMLEMHYSCGKCKDTGWIGTTERKPCACRLKLMARLDPEIGINQKETFENFRDGIYPKEEQKRHAINAKKVLERYADMLPSPEKPNIFLT